MPKSDRPLEVDIPIASDERPAWSRVGVVAVVGFAVGILWPKLAGVRVGPGVPGEAHVAAEASAAPPSSVPSNPTLAPPIASAGASASATPANQELVVVAPSKTTKCYDKKDRKVEECDKIAFDALLGKKLKELSACPAALGLEGKMTLGVDVAFDKKDVGVSKVKKGSTLPSSTVNGILQCAAKELKDISLEELQHKHKRYSLQVPLTFYPPNKRPEGAPAEAADGDEKETPGKAAEGESPTTGTATVAWDTALLRKTAKDGDVVTRLVRGTHVKVLSKEGDWLKVESNGKTGWLYRGAVGQ